MNATDGKAVLGVSREHEQKEDVIVISGPTYIIAAIIICYLLLMIVYVGIGRASLLINIVRFRSGRPSAMRKKPSTRTASDGPVQLFTIAARNDRNISARFDFDIGEQIREMHAEYNNRAV